MFSSHTMKVLLIEDNPGDARLILEMVRSARNDVITLETARTLSAGLAALETTTYDVVMLDLSLPDSHGIDTLNQIQLVMSEVAVVVLTGEDSQQIGIRAVQLGAQDYLPKSEIDSKLLIRTLHYALERHQSHAALKRSREEYRSLIDDVFDSSMVGVIILNREFQVVWCNEATEVYFGISRDQLISQDKRSLIDNTIKCIFEDPEDYAKRLFEAYDLGSFSGRFECHVVPGENREERWLEHWSQPIRSGMYSGGRIEQYMDITHRKLLGIAEQEQRQFTEALIDTLTLMTSTLDLEEVLEHLLVNLHRVIPHDSAVIAISEEEQLWMARRDSQTSDVHIIVKKPTSVREELYWEVLNDASSSIIDDLDAPTEIGGKRTQSHMGEPILLQGEGIGFITLFSFHPDFFNEKDAARLTAFVQSAAIAIQNARWYQESIKLATLEERQRLARELHDSVSQTLFTCRTMSETSLRRWHNDPQKARDLMEDVHNLIIAALEEMRVLLLELRPETLNQISLEDLFEQFLKPIQDRRRFSLQLTIDDLPELMPDVKIGLYRIAQEALNNIDKHASATRVEISIGILDDMLTMYIHDNGRGFDQQQVKPTSLGISIMKERAREIGATLNIISEQSEGTGVRVQWNVSATKG